jgi:hypothetical protein
LTQGKESISFDPASSNFVSLAYVSDLQDNFTQCRMVGGDPSIHDIVHVAGESSRSYVLFQRKDHERIGKKKYMKQKKNSNASIVFMNLRIK